MIGSPSPTQQPPERPAPEPKKVTSTSRRRAGQTPTAQFVKGLFRPLLKGLYYLLRAVNNHKLVSLLAILLILGSATAVTYYETGNWPFSIGKDPFNFNVHGGNGGGDQVRNWLYALRDGNVATVGVLDRFMSQPPDPQQLVDQFSQPKAHLTWKTINVVGVQQESDSSIDSFVEVDLAASGPGGTTSEFVLFHFVTATSQTGSSFLVAVSVVQLRGTLAP
jgi:hypothetical protein